MNVKKTIAISLMIIAYMFFIIINHYIPTKEQLTKESSLRIVTSFYPMYLHVKELTQGVDVEVVNLTSPEVGCLHDYQLTVADMKVLQTADILVINGLGAESFIDKAYEQNKTLKIVEATDAKSTYVIDRENTDLHEDITEHEEEQHDDHEGHDHEEEQHDDHEGHNHENEHVWVSIEGSIEQVRTIADKLAILDPDNASLYKANEQSYVQQLETLKDQVAEDLAGLQMRSIVTVHGAFDYFAEEFNLDNVATISGDSHKTPTAKEIEEIIKTLKDKDVHVIFTEKQYEHMGIVKTIAGETKSMVYVLDSFVTPGKDLKGIEPEYIERTKKNVSVLKEACER